MRVLVDEQPVQVTEPTLAAALEAARLQAEAMRRVVVEATVDGLVIPDEALTSPSTESFENSEVRFVTAEPVALVHTTLQGVSELLDQTKAQQTHAADLIAKGQLEPAMNELSKALNAWDSVHHAVIGGAALLGLNAEDLVVCIGEGGVRVTVAACVRELGAKLGELKRTISTQDWAGLGDALAYDMSEQADRWIVLLDSLSGEIGRLRPDSTTPSRMSK